MGQVRVEFTVEPFVEGGPGPHVLAAADALRVAGFEPEDGPFGTTLQAEAEPLFAALAEIPRTALAAGATGVTMSIHPVQALSAGAAALVEAVRPLVEALGGSLVPATRMRPGDVPLTWEGETVVGVRRSAALGTDLADVLSSVIAEVEAILGSRLGSLSRGDKQKAARMLAERGVFQLRNAVDDVADAMGVSRATIYNYLGATRHTS
jgi:uncharacterized protein YqgV (UPF0045/DUF77 family)